MAQGVCSTPLEASHVRLHLEYSVRNIRVSKENNLVVAPGLEVGGEDGTFPFKALVFRASTAASKSRRVPAASDAT